MIIIPDDVIKDDKLDVKENGTLITHKGDVVQEQVPIDKVPEKLFGNVRSQDLPELLDAVKVEEVAVSEVQKESELEDLNELEESSTDVTNASSKLEPEQSESNRYPNFNIDKARQKLVDWSKNEDGSINKRPLLKWFLDVDGGVAQSVENYRYPTGYVIDGNPQYCKLSLDASWDLASGKQTGVANRNIQKKIIFIKNREGIPLTEDQMDFTERHMSAEKVTYHTLEDDNSPGGLDFVEQTELKLNASPAGSKIIYEDENVIDVPVVPMREGVFTGTDGIPTLKKFEYFGKDAHWLEGQPILKGHTAPTELVTYKHNRIGKLMNVTARPDKKDVVAVARYYKDKLTPEDMTRIKSGTPYDGSIAYTTHTSMTSGDLNGTKYNAIEDGGYHFYHFAELANGIGACSTKDGCGFMLNEKGYEPKVFYNNKRRAEVTRNDDVYTVKLNSSIGGSGVLEANTEQDAIEWSKTYVKSGLIPISMKLNYNCPNSEKSGSGKGACSGSDGKESSSKGKVPEKRTVMIPGDKSGKKYKVDFAPERKFKEIISHGRMLKEETNPKTGDVTYRGMNNKTATVSKTSNGKWKVTAGTVFEDEEREIYDNETDAGLAAKRFAAGKGIKRNSQFSKLTGNNMSEEFIQAEDNTEEVVDVQKMNEAFEQKLNERDAKIAELTAQVEDLVQKQNAAEQALVDKKAAEDFEAFTQKLNKAHQKDAKVHYEGFKSDGWAYFGAHPEVFQAEIPKMNAKGSPADEGDNASALQQARDMLRKGQKERFSKRA